MTYGDGLSNVNIRELAEFHHRQKKLATLTAVLPEGRFGVMDLDQDIVKSFREKKKTDTGWINGGFMVLNTKVLDNVEGDTAVFEKEPMERLAAQGQMTCYRHDGFWQCMDTLRDKQKLEKLWDSGQAPWKVW